MTEQKSQAYRKRASELRTQAKAMNDAVASQSLLRVASEKRTSIVEGRARRSYGHGKPMGTWEVMIRDHHEGYIDWAEYERNQKQLALNNYGRP